MLEVLSADQPSAEDLAHAHQELLYTWVLAPQNVPPGWIALDGLIALQERRVEVGVAQTDFLRLSKEAAFELSQRGRHRDGRDFVQAVTPFFAGPSANLAYLWMRLAGLHRALEERDAGLRALERAEEEIARLPQDDPERLELHVSSQAHRTYLFLDRGLVDLAATSALRCYNAGAEALEARDPRAPYLFHEGLLARLAQLAAADRHADLLAFVERAHVREALAKDDAPSRRAQIRLRQAIALTNLENEQPERPRRALDMLRELRDEALASTVSADEATLLHSSLAVAAIDAGELAEARTSLAACRKGVSDTLRLRAHVHALSARAALRDPTPPTADDLRKHRDALESIYAELLQRWKARPPLATGEGFTLISQFNELVVEYAAIVLDLDEEKRGVEHALEILLRLQAVQSLGKSMRAEPVSLAQTRAQLGPGEGLVFLLTGWRHSLAFTVDTSSVEPHVLPTYARLATLRRTLLDTLETQLFSPRPDEDAVDRAVRTFAQAFYQDGLRERIAAWSSLSLVEQQSLGYLPYELLPWEENETLGERFAVDYLPSLPIARELAKRRTPPDESFGFDVLVPFPKEAPEGELAFGPYERKLLLDGWPGASPQLLTEKKARLAALRPEAPAWLLIGHGKRTSESPRPQGVRLFDSVLTPERAETLDVPDTVLLLACNAWRGPWRRGDDGRGHLIGSFLLAGANVLVAPSMRIDYHSGLALARWTIEGLAADLSPARALQLARRRARETFVSPALLWNASLLHVVGLGQRPR